MAGIMVARQARRLLCKPQITFMKNCAAHVRSAGQSAANSTTQSVDMKILQESIKKTVEKNPDLVAPPAKQDSAEKTSSSLPLSEGSSDLAEYDKLQLSKENVMVDTYALIKVFTEKGFTQQQAECITYTYTQLMNNALREQRSHCVDKAGLDVMREQMMAHIGALRKDMIILEKSELSDLRNENEKLKHLVQQHKSLISEEVNKVRSQLTLDINFERSRAKDEYIQVEKNIANLTTKMTADVGSMETKFERYKHDIYRYIGGSAASAIIFAITMYVRTQK